MVWDGLNHRIIIAPALRVVHVAAKGISGEGQWSQRSNHTALVFL
jgi:hypothetical protein